MEALQAQEERDTMADLRHQSQTQSRDILLARVKEKEEQVRRLREGIGLVTEITERRQAMMAARERKLEERHRFDNKTVVEWEILLRDLYDQSKGLLDKEIADLLQVRSPSPFVEY